MFIKDLDKSSDLDRDERIVVRGGVAGNSVYAVMVGSALLNGASGVSVGSPVVQANPQTQTIGFVAQPALSAPSSVVSAD
jgi:hypothetical protein